MSGIGFGAIAPHGHCIIEELAGEEVELFETLREGMKKLSIKIKNYNPDIIIVLTPHGVKLEGYNAIYTSEYCGGTLSFCGNTVQTNFKCNQKMAKEIFKRAVCAEIPTVGVNFGTGAGNRSKVEMDWATMIPLWYSYAQKQIKPEIVVINPTRDISREKLVELGEIIAKIAEESGQRVALIASADQSHTHDPNGIYGYDPHAKEYDEKIISIVKEDKLEELLNIDEDLVDKAKPCGLWQMLILHGALNVVDMKSELICYDVPTYFGMLVASFE